MYTKGGHMKQILVKSVYDAFEYVMDHYYPYGLEEFAMRKDSYAVISIQDTHTDGFGFTFTQSRSCRRVLTLYFDDIVKEVPGAVLFDETMAQQIIDFAKDCIDVDTLLIHCYAGQSRSLAIGRFISEIYGLPVQEGNYNQYVYALLKETYHRIHQE